MDYLELAKQLGPVASICALIIVLAWRREQRMVKAIEKSSRETGMRFDTLERKHEGLEQEYRKLELEYRGDLRGMIGECLKMMHLNALLLGRIRCVKMDDCPAEHEVFK